MKLLLTYCALALLGANLLGCSSDASKQGASSAAGAPNAGAAGAAPASGGSGGSPSDVGSAGALMTEPGSAPSVMPIISHGVPAFGSATAPSSGAANANDGKPATAWLSNAVPAWLAYDLSGVPAEQRHEVLVAWYDGTTEDFINPTLDPSKHWPIDYTLETNAAAGGGDPPTDGWVVVDTVTGNDRNTRQRLFDLNGANWVRMNVKTSSNPAEVALDLDVHSAPMGATDSWLFMGDSITFISTPYLFSDLPELVNMDAPERWPAIIPGGIGGTNTVTALAAIANTMQDFPGRFVVLGYGTNDHPTDFHMEELVQAVIAAGKVPVVPHMPWSDEANIQDAGPQINATIDALYMKYPQIMKGPDFWAIFKERTDLIPSGDIHPNGTGQEEWRKQWALVMTQ